LIAGQELVEYKLAEQFVCFVYLAQLESIKPDTCAAITDVCLEGPGPNRREIISASWAKHFPATLMSAMGH
jgi:hypothetical protein